MGVDIACKLLDTFSGGYMYIPKKSTIKKDFLHALIRLEAKTIKKEEHLKMTEIVRLLANKYVLDEETIYRILGIKNTDSLEKGIFKKKKQIDYIRDENLLSILKKNWDKLVYHKLF